METNSPNARGSIKMLAARLQFPFFVVLNARA